MRAAPRRGGPALAACGCVCARKSSAAPWVCRRPDRFSVRSPRMPRLRASRPRASRRSSASILVSIGSLSRPAPRVPRRQRRRPPIARRRSNSSRRPRRGRAPRPRRRSRATARRAGTYTAAPGAAPLSRPLSGITGSALRPANTFSIVARDPVTGELGVAVQSHWFSVGALVAWAEPGVGAVATQSFVEPAYGPQGPRADARRRARAGRADAARSPPTRPRPCARSAFVDAQGRAGAHTGARCIAARRPPRRRRLRRAGEPDGERPRRARDARRRSRPRRATSPSGCSPRSTRRRRPAATSAAASRRRSSSSAASAPTTPWKARKLDLRVEDSAAPLAELRRLVTLARAYDHMNQGDLAIEKNDMRSRARALRGGRAHGPRQRRDGCTGRAWRSPATASTTRPCPLLRRAFEADPAWIELTRRLPAAGLLDAAAAERIVREAKAAK